jgi:hypothetical protein
VMNLATAAEYALVLTATGPQEAPVPDALGKLSTRERELVTLVARDSRPIPARPGQAGDTAMFTHPDPSDSSPSSTTANCWHKPASEHCGTSTAAGPPGRRVSV